MLNKSVSFEFSEVSEEALAALQKLEFSKTGTRRLCLHNSEEDLLHAMLVEIQPDTFFRYHKHSSDEFVLVLRGCIQILELPEGKRLFRPDTLSGGIIPAGTVHAVQAGLEGALYLEVIRGPFVR